MADETLPPNGENRTAPETDRRAFLKGAGKYALVVPPAMTFLLSTTMTSEAVAQSGGGGGAGGTGGGSTPGVPPRPSWWPKWLPWPLF